MTKYSLPSVKLRALEPEDLDLLYTIENDRELWDVSETNTPMSKFVIRQYLANQPQDVFQAGEVRLVIEDASLTTAVGLIDLTGVSVTNRSAEIGIALLKSDRGKGYGTVALQSIEEYAKNNLQLRFLYCKVSLHHNPKSKYLFESNSYKKIAVLPEWHFHNGEYEDLILYQKKL